MSSLYGRPENIKIPVCEPHLTLQDSAAVVEAIRSTWISGISKTVRDFEKAFAEYCDVKYGVATNSGTTAIHLALSALGVGKGDEVIIPDFTMIATLNPILQLGAKPVLVDCEMEAWNINPKLIEEAITNKTKVIMPVHIYGHPCDMNEINKIASNHNIVVLEDAAEAHGSKYWNKKAGSLGHAACFSFFANKVITTGEGGMIVTNNKNFAKRSLWLGSMGFGKDKHYEHSALGYGYRMSGLQAALGISQVERIGELVAKKRLNAKMYGMMLEKLSDENLIALPLELEYAKNIYWLYSILINPKLNNRDKIATKLAQDYGIETRPFFTPMHKQPFLKKLGLNLGSDDDFACSVTIADSGLNLPSSTRLTGEEITYVCEALRKCMHA